MKKKSISKEQFSKVVSKQFPEVVFKDGIKIRHKETDQKLSGGGESRRRRLYKAYPLGPGQIWPSHLGRSISQ